jgi:type IV secretory pathway TrbD component
MRVTVQYHKELGVDGNIRILIAAAWMEAEVMAAKAALADPELVVAFERTWRRKLRAHHPGNPLKAVAWNCALMMCLLAALLLTFPVTHTAYKVLSNDDPTVRKIWDAVRSKRFRNEECLVRACGHTPARI